MKFVTEEMKAGKPVFVNVYWGDHYAGCPKCATVDLDKPATFVNACAQGSPLLNEELIKRQAPAVRQKQKEVRARARKAGVFKNVGRD